MFYESWGFWFIIGLFIGGAVGFITAAILASSKKGSMDNYVYRGRRREK